MTSYNKKITLFVMTQKGYEVLNVITNKYSDLIDFVVSARDHNIQRDYYDEIKTHCSSSKIKFYERSESYKVTTKYAITISWRWMINLSSTTLIVFHDSLLPKYRGFNPLVSALINGENRIGVTALFASETYDKGDIIYQLSSNIIYPIKIQEAIEIIICNYKELALKIVRAISNGTALKGIRQDDDEDSYSLWRDEEDYRIDWTKSVEYIKRFVDAVGFPYKGAATIVHHRLARVTDVEILNDVYIENRTPGKVIWIHDLSPVVVCGQGLLKIQALIDDSSKQSLLPLRSFRVRFK